MRRAMLLAALAFLPSIVAGCVVGAGPDGTAPAGPPALAAGKGAIAGLLVDDRFRPIHLTDQPNAPYEAAGFVLLQETGQQIQTTADGEFLFVDLDPGTYTLRVQASDHEAVPQKVQVRAGEFAEASIVARRLLSAGDAVVTEEYTAFVPCQVNVLAAALQCTLIPPDMSGETDRQDFRVDYTTLPASYVVIEMKSNKDAGRDGALKVVARNATDALYVANDAVTDGDYMRVWLENGAKSPFDLENRNMVWTNEDGLQVEIWAQGQYKQETQPVFSDVTCAAGAYCDWESRGVGVQAGLVVRFVITIFLGPPETDIDTFCVLC